MSPVRDRYRHGGMPIPGDCLEHFLHLPTWDVPLTDNAAVITQARRRLACACAGAVGHLVLQDDVYAVDVWLCAVCGVWTCWIRPHGLDVFAQMAWSMAGVASGQ